MDNGEKYNNGLAVLDGTVKNWGDGLPAANAFCGCTVGGWLSPALAGAEAIVPVEHS